MITTFMVLAIAGLQAPSGVGAQEDPYEVQDPFALEAPESQAQAQPQPQPNSAAAAVSVQAAAQPSGERLICRSRPQLGTRVVSVRVCKTADEWRIYNTDLEASRRDINDRGARGCDAETMPECF